VTSLKLIKVRDSSCRLLQSQIDLPVHELNCFHGVRSNSGIMRGDDKGHLFFSAQTFEQFNDFTAGVGIQIARRFVGK